MQPEIWLLSTTLIKHSRYVGNSWGWLTSHLAYGTALVHSAFVVGFGVVYCSDRLLPVCLPWVLNGYTRACICSYDF